MSAEAGLFPQAVEIGENSKLKLRRQVSAFDQGMGSGIWDHRNGEGPNTVRNK